MTKIIEIDGSKVLEPLQKLMTKFSKSNGRGKAISGTFLGRVYQNPLNFRIAGARKRSKVVFDKVDTPEEFSENSIISILKKMLAKFNQIERELNKRLEKETGCNFKNFEYSEIIKELQRIDSINDKFEYMKELKNNIDNFLNKRDDEFNMFFSDNINEIDFYQKFDYLMYRIKEERNKEFQSLINKLEFNYSKKINDLFISVEKKYLEQAIEPSSSVNIYKENNSILLTALEFKGKKTDLMEIIVGMHEAELFSKEYSRKELVKIFSNIFKTSLSDSNQWTDVKNRYEKNDLSVKKKSILYRMHELIKVKIANKIS